MHIAKILANPDPAVAILALLESCELWNYATSDWLGNKMQTLEFFTRSTAARQKKK